MTLIRKLKALGLALVAVFAMSAMAASAASAQVGTITADGPLTLKGVNRVGAEEKANSLTQFGQVVTCSSTTYTGHKAEVTPHEKIPNDSSTVTITPNYGTCQIGATIKMTVDMNGCDFLFHLGETSTPPADRYKITDTVLCPAGKHIVWTLFTNATFHAENKSFCHITITEKPSYDGLFLTDNTNNTFSLNGTIEGIEADKEIIAGTTPDTGILCPKESNKLGILHFDVTFTEASNTPIKLSHL